MTPLLFTSYQIKSVQLRNRIVVSPMCQYSSTDGFADNWHLVHLGSMATGGAGLIITEATAISPEGRISFADLGIYKDEHITKLKEITDFIHQQGAIAGTQLAHAGRKASHMQPWLGGKQIPSNQPNGWKTLGPSAIAFADGEEAPLELDKAGIEKVKADFKAAAARALQAGFKLIELHGAHGYLIHQFLSPLSNQRTDEYGGVFENRARLLLEIIDEVKQVWPADLPLFVRLSATDWTEGGWNITETVQLAKLLKDKGVDVIDTSTAGNVLAKIPVGPGYQVRFAEQIRREADIATGAVGMITNAQQAENILEEGMADLIIMARELLRDPHFPLRAASELGYDEVKWPEQYERAKWPKLA